MSVRPSCSPHSERDDQASGSRDPGSDDWVFGTIKPNKQNPHKVPNGAAAVPVEDPDAVEAEPEQEQVRTPQRSSRTF